MSVVIVHQTLGYVYNVLKIYVSTTQSYRPQSRGDLCPIMAYNYKRHLKYKFKQLQKLLLSLKSVTKKLQFKQYKIIIIRIKNLAEEKIINKILLVISLNKWIKFDPTEASGFGITWKRLNRLSIPICRPIFQISLCLKILGKHKKKC